MPHDFIAAAPCFALRLAELPPLVAGLVVLWFVVIGGSVGSFLNVVIYRLPLGLSLVRPGSRCPRCMTPILARDNLPIVGWLKLRGRCRACGEPISARYPLVELTAALILLGLALAEPLGGGWNLPVSRGPSGTAIEPLWGTLAYHFVLCCGLLAAALMTFDGQAVPRSMWNVLWLGGFAAGVVWPQLRPLAGPRFASVWQSLGVGTLDGLLGTSVGLLLGAASWPASTIGARGRTGHVAGMAAGALLGTYLGWQAATVVVFVAGAIWGLWQLVRRFGAPRAPDVSWLEIVLPTTLGWLFAWRLIVDTWPALGPRAPWYLPPAAIIGTLVITAAGRTTADALRRRHT